MEVKIKKIKPDAVVPSYGTEFSAGADLYSPCDVEIGAGQTVAIGTGIQISLPKNTVGLVFARSGLALKKGLAPANKVGVIDCDYRGEITVALHNHGSENQKICKGDRIAQLVVMPYVSAEFVVSDVLDDTQRGEGGFGSTGR